MDESTVPDAASRLVEIAIRRMSKRGWTPRLANSWHALNILSEIALNLSSFNEPFRLRDVE